MFFVTVFVIWGGTHTYLYFRVKRLLGLGAEARPWLIGGLVLLAASYFLARGVDAWLAREAALGLYWPGALWIGFVGLLGTTLVVYELVVTLPTAVVGWVGGGLPGWVVAARTWGLRAAFGVAAVGLAFGLSRTFAGPSLRTVEVPLPGLPAALDGFTLAQVSDVHLGELVSPDYQTRIERVVAQADADLVVVTGDLTDEPPGRALGGLKRLATLKNRRGVVAVTGNHERYAGGEAIVRTMRAAGLDTLRQEHRVIDDGLVIAGIDDPAFLEGGRSGMSSAITRAVQDAPADLPIVLLSHQPLALDAAASQGIDLMLTGHTHGGQLPPFTWLNRLVYPVASGQAEVGGMHLIVSNGAGWWGPPVRVFADPEVVKVVLRSAAGVNAR
jgi:predicted MPP superfamily phosphohydrolase